jgi:hypothetical protein
MSTLLSYLRAIFAKSAGDAPDYVIYAGAEPAPMSNYFEFGFYIPVSPTQALWMPGYALEPNVIEDLRSLPLGASFRIVAQEAEGPFGTMIHQVALSPHAPVYDLSEEGGALPHVDELPAILKL